MRLGENVHDRTFVPVCGALRDGPCGPAKLFASLCALKLGTSQGASQSKYRDHPNQAVAPGSRHAKPILRAPLSTTPLHCTTPLFALSPRPSRCNWPVLWHKAANRTCRASCAPCNVSTSPRLLLPRRDMIWRRNTTSPAQQALLDRQQSHSRRSLLPVGKGSACPAPS